MSLFDKVVIKYVILLLTILGTLTLGYFAIKYTGGTIGNINTAKFNEVTNLSDVDRINYFTGIDIQVNDAKISQDGVAHGTIVLFSRLPIYVKLTANDSRFSFLNKTSGTYTTELIYALMMKNVISDKYVPTNGEKFADSVNVSIYYSFNREGPFEFYKNVTVKIIYDISSILMIKNYATRLLNYIYVDDINNYDKNELVNTINSMSSSDLYHHSIIIESLIKSSAVSYVVNVTFVCHGDVRNSVKPLLAFPDVEEFDVKYDSSSNTTVYTKQLIIGVNKKYIITFITNDFIRKDDADFSIEWVNSYSGGTQILDKIAYKIQLISDYGLNYVSYSSLSYSIPMVTFAKKSSGTIGIGESSTKPKRILLSFNVINNDGFPNPYTLGKYSLDGVSTLLLMPDSGFRIDDKTGSAILLTDSLNNPIDKHVIIFGNDLDEYIHTSEGFRVYAYNSPVYIIYPYSEASKSMGQIESKISNPVISYTNEGGIPVLSYDVSYYIKLPKSQDPQISSIVYTTPSSLSATGNKVIFIDFTKTQNENLDYIYNTIVNEMTKTYNVNVYNVGDAEELANTLKTISTYDTDLLSAVRPSYKLNTLSDDPEVDVLYLFMGIYEKFLSDHKNEYPYNYYIYNNKLGGLTYDPKNKDQLHYIISAMTPPSYLTISDLINNGVQNVCNENTNSCLLNASGSYWIRDFAGKVYPIWSLKYKNYSFMLPKENDITIFNEPYKSPFFVILLTNSYMGMPLKNNGGNLEIDIDDNTIKNIVKNSYLFDYLNTTHVNTNGEYKQISYFKELIPGVSSHDSSHSSATTGATIVLKSIEKDDEYIKITFHVEVVGFGKTFGDNKFTEFGYLNPISVYSINRGLVVNYNIDSQTVDIISPYKALIYDVNNDGKLPYDELFNKYLHFYIPFEFMIELHTKNISGKDGYYMFFKSDNNVLIPINGIIKELSKKIVSSSTLNTEYLREDAIDPMEILNSYYSPLFVTGIAEGTISRALNPKSSFNDILEQNIRFPIMPKIYYQNDKYLVTTNFLQKDVQNNNILIILDPKKIINSKGFAVQKGNTEVVLSITYDMGYENYYEILIDVSNKLLNDEPMLSRLIKFSNGALTPYFIEPDHIDTSSNILNNAEKVFSISTSESCGSLIVDYDPKIGDLPKKVYVKYTGGSCNILQHNIYYNLIFPIDEFVSVSDSHFHKTIAALVDGKRFGNFNGKNYVIDYNFFLRHGTIKYFNYPGVIISGSYYVRKTVTNVDSFAQDDYKTGDLVVTRFIFSLLDGGIIGFDYSGTVNYDNEELANSGTNNALDQFVLINVFEENNIYLLQKLFEFKYSENYKYGKEISEPISSDDFRIFGNINEEYSDINTITLSSGEEVGLLQTDTASAILLYSLNILKLQKIDLNTFIMQNEYWHT